jgi:HEAT repeat protein
VVIKASSRARVATLIAQLSDPDALVRDTAVGRLRVIGLRAIDRLIAVASDRTSLPHARIAALKALEAVDEERALESVLTAIGDPDEAVAAAAATAAGSFLRQSRGAAAVDRLAGVALDIERGVAVRMAALKALGDLASAELAPLKATLAGDPAPEVSAWATSPARGDSEEAADWIDEAIGQGLTAPPAACERALLTAGDAVPSTTLLQLIQAVQARERTENAAKRAQWLELRGLAHARLAARQSRLALYDLRETVSESPTQLPSGFYLALLDVGDASCLEPIAQAISRAAEVEWRDRLVSAFKKIAAREHITSRHAVSQKIAKRWPSAAALVRGGLTPRASRPSRTTPR